MAAKIQSHDVLEWYSVVEWNDQIYYIQSELIDGILF